jgi:hypothetical protein
MIRCTIPPASLTDPDFNRAPNGAQGTGADVVHYRVPIGGAAGLWKVTARVWYQSLPPKWMNPLFEYSTPEIDSFRTMYNAADLAPVLLSETVLDSVAVLPVSTAAADWEKSIRLGPNPSRDGRVQLQVPAGLRVERIRAYNAGGQLVWESGAASDIQLPRQRGMYWVSVETKRGQVVRKVVVE